MPLLRRAAELTRAGSRVALATVIDTRGSVPRHPGATMLVVEDGSIFGTIGGGRVEAEVTREGRAIARGAAAKRFEFHLTRDLAMCCGGSMTVFIEPVAPSLSAIAAAAQLREARQCGLLITELDGSGKSVERMADPPPRRPHLEGERFIEPIRPSERLVMFGAGHVARAVGPVAASVGFEVIVCDDDETGALDHEMPWAAVRIPSFALTDVEGVIGRLGVGDHVLVITRDHAVDQKLVERLLPNPNLTYLGLIGSLGKVGRFEKRILAKGVVGPEEWARLRAPIGLDIGAETPAEIAVAVVAELVAMRRGDGP